MKHTLQLTTLCLLLATGSYAQTPETDIKSLIESNKELSAEINDINLRIDRFSASKSVSSTFFVISVATAGFYFYTDEKSKEFLYASAISGAVSYVIMQFSGAGMRKKSKRTIR